MQSYELMIIVRADTGEITEKAGKEIVEAFVGKAGLEVVSVALLGKKSLAYPIQKQTEGIYILSKVNGSVKVSELQSKANTDKVILRFLLTRI